MNNSNRSKRLAYFVIISLMLSLALSACVSSDTQLASDELVSDWPNAVIYEIFVRAFNDSDGDGIGDFNGITAKLDYLKDLGIEGLWLMPINPSPSYHGYDVTDYYDVNPEYGSLDDFKNLVAEAHKRDIKIIIDLVVNHTSKGHPWFKESASSQDNPKRDWYVWADDKTRTTELGDWGQQVWHGLNNKYYGVFWDGMPDLNYDHPDVRAEMVKAGQFWLDEIGIDGFRLDAAKYIYSHEHEKSQEWWQEFKSAMEQSNPDVFLVGEVWDTPGVVGPYFKGLNSNFNFDLSTNIFNAVKSGGGSSIPSYLQKVRAFYEKTSEDFIDSTFLTNHDMNRVMTELGGDIDKAKMAASLLLTLPGNPFLYYGEEIGMMGAKPDEHIREPMKWTGDSTAPGQSNWIISKYNSSEKTVPVDVQLEDENSLLNHYKTMIHVRRSSEALVSGEIVPVDVKENGVITFERVHGDQVLYVVHNVTKEEKTVPIPEGQQSFTDTYFVSSKEIKVKKKKQVTLPPYSTVILSK